jgi:2'-5' RNA ligase
MNGCTYEYSSTQINLPGTLSWDIFVWGEQHVPEQSVFCDPDDPSFGREDELHVTVLYGIHSDNHHAIERLVGSSHEPFWVTLGQISIFKDHGKFDVVKVEAESPYLHKLHYLFLNNTLATKLYPTYKPHVTIAYTKKDACNHLVGDRFFAGKEFLADRLIFSSKSGKRTSFYL